MRQHPVFHLTPDLEASARAAHAAHGDYPVPGGRDAVDQLMDAFGEFKDHHDSRMAAMQEQIDRVETILNRPAVFGGSSVGGNTPSVGPSRELSAAFRHFARTGDDSRMAAMTTQSDPDGGYLVLPERSREMTTRLFDLSPMRRLARVITLTASGTFEEPVDKDDVAATWCSETETRTEDTTPQLGLLTINAHESYALVAISQKLMDDSSIDLWAWMTAKLSGKFARQEGTAFISGTGDPSQPAGILSYPVASTGDSTRPWGTLTMFLRAVQWRSRRTA